jgi:hypothetical protein
LGIQEITPAPVVHVGEIFEDGCMAIVATNFLSFLAVETAISALMDVDAAVLKRLHIPNNLIKEDDGTDVALRQWADPLFPETSADPYVSRLDARALRKLLA